MLQREIGQRPAEGATRCAGTPGLGSKCGLVIAANLMEGSYVSIVFIVWKSGMYELVKITRETLGSDFAARRQFSAPSRAGMSMSCSFD